MERLSGAGVRDITVRLDKGFFSRRMVRTLERRGVSFLLKVPRHCWLKAHHNHWRFSAKRGSGLLLRSHSFDPYSEGSVSSNPIW